MGDRLRGGTFVVENSAQIHPLHRLHGRQTAQPGQRGRNVGVIDQLVVNDPRATPRHTPLRGHPADGVGTDARCLLHDAVDAVIHAVIGVKDHDGIFPSPSRAQRVEPSPDEVIVLSDQGEGRPPDPARPGFQRAACDGFGEGRDNCAYTPAREKFTEFSEKFQGQNDPGRWGAFLRLCRATFAFGLPAGEN